jgi:hypothetical protein
MQQKYQILGGMGKSVTQITFADKSATTLPIFATDLLTFPESGM